MPPAQRRTEVFGFVMIIAVAGRRHVKTLMKRMEIEALYRRPRTTKPEPGHKIYPYLLCGMKITRPNQVWAMDITYIPMARGFAAAGTSGFMTIGHTFETSRARKNKSREGGLLAPSECGGHAPPTCPMSLLGSFQSVDRLNVVHAAMIPLDAKPSASGLR